MCPIHWANLGYYPTLPQPLQIWRHEQLIPFSPKISSQHSFFLRSKWRVHSWGPSSFPRFCFHKTQWVMLSKPTHLISRNRYTFNLAMLKIRDLGKTLTAQKVRWMSDLCSCNHSRCIYVIIESVGVCHVPLSHQTEQNDDSPWQMSMDKPEMTQTLLNAK